MSADDYIAEGEAFLRATERAPEIHPDHARRVVSTLVFALDTEHNLLQEAMRAGGFATVHDYHDDYWRIRGDRDRLRAALRAFAKLDLANHYPAALPIGLLVGAKDQYQHVTAADIREARRAYEASMEPPEGAPQP